MPGIVRKDTDSAGGKEIGGLAPTVFADGMMVIVLGDKVAGHGPGKHGGPVMAEASSTVFAHGIGVCRAGDHANCGHPASGSSDVIVG